MPLLEIAKSYITGTVEDSRQMAKIKEISQRNNEQGEMKKEKTDKRDFNKQKAPMLVKKKEKKISQKTFTIGDSVMVFPEKAKGCVFAELTDEGTVGVQVKGRKKWIQKRRLKLLVAASELYPADYDFSIIFDSVDNRKAKHAMQRKGYKAGRQAVYKSEEEAKFGASK